MSNGRESKKSKHSDSIDKNIDIDHYIKKIELGDTEITMNIKKQKNPIELLEKFYLVRNNKSLNDDMSTLFWTVFYRTIYLNFLEFICKSKIIYLIPSRVNKLAIARP